jgi:hypothetical protein
MQRHGTADWPGRLPARIEKPITIGITMKMYGATIR